MNATVNKPFLRGCPQASTSSHGMLTLDLVAEEDGAFQEYDDDCDGSWENDLQVDLQRAGSHGQADVIRSRQRADTDASKLRVTSKEPKVKTSSLPRGSERSWGKNSHPDAAKVHKKHQVQVGASPPGLPFCFVKSKIVTTRRALHPKAGQSQTPDQVLTLVFKVLQAQSRTPQPGKRFVTHARSRCASMDEVLSSRYSSGVQTVTGTFALQLQHLFLAFLRPALIRSELRTALRRCPTEEAAGSVAPEQPVGQLQSLIAQRMQRAQELLEEMRLQVRCSLEVSGAP